MPLGVFDAGHIRIGGMEPLTIILYDGPGDLKLKVLRSEIHKAKLNVERCHYLQGSQGRRPVRSNGIRTGGQQVLFPAVPGQ